MAGEVPQRVRRGPARARQPQRGGDRGTDLLGADLLGAGRGAQVHEPHAAGEARGDPLRRGDGQGRLAAARAPDERHGRPAGDAALQVRHLRGAPDQARPPPRQLHLGELDRRRLPTGGDAARGLRCAGENEPVQPAELGTGLHAELVAQQPVDAPVGGRRVPDPSRPSCGEQILLPRPLAQRLRGQHRLQLGQRPVRARVGQQPVDEGLGEPAAEFLQPRDGRRGPGFVAPRRVRAVPPQPARLLGQRDHPSRLPTVEQIGRLLGQPGEQDRVDPVAIGDQAVPTGLGDQRDRSLAAAASGFQEAAQPVQVGLQGRHRARRGPVAPHRVHQRADVHPAAGVDEQARQQPAQHRSARRALPAVLHDGDRSQITEPQHARLGHGCTDLPVS